MKKRIYIAVILLLICLAGQRVLRPARAEQSAAEPKIETPEAPQPSGPQTPSFQGQTGREDLFRDLLRQLAVMVVFIAVAGAAVWWAAKRYRNRTWTRSDGRVRVVETVPLGPRKMLHVVEAGSRKLLIGNTADRITFLSDITDALAAKPFSVPGLDEESGT